jgi:hypothetical protein
VGFNPQDLWDKGLFGQLWLGGGGGGGGGLQRRIQSSTPANLLTYFLLIKKNYNFLL